MSKQDIEITTAGPAATEESCGCGCCGGVSPAEQASTVEVGTGSTTKQYAVAGMTCGHCVSAVTQELSELAGVEAVDVALVAGATSTVTVVSSGQVSDEAVAAAIGEAGYTVVSA